MAGQTDWFLTADERGNRSTQVDAHHGGSVAWSEGNLVRPLVHGATYFRELYDQIEATVPGDLVLFTDWQGDADERLTGEPGSEVVDVLGRADERGVDVRGLIWRSHSSKMSMFATENRTLGEQLQDRGAEALLDMRVRWGGSHHQKMVVIRHRDDPSRDIAFVGGIDLSHARRDDHLHHGDPQPQPLSKEYGDRPPWHDCQAAITGPAVYDVESSFRERWEDPTPLTRHPFRRLADAVRRLDITPDPLPAQQPPPPAAGSYAVQVLRTYPDLRNHRDYAFAVGGERSIARGYRKALGRTERIVYLEDQYLWGHDVGESLTDALKQHPDLHIVAVVPLVPDMDGAFSRTPQLLGRLHAISVMDAVAPGRVHVYSIENHAGTPVYVHAKVCVLDDIWAIIGSDNFNRRSWTHDSEISVAVVDQSEEPTYARDLRLTMAAEHLDRDMEDLSSVDDCVDPLGMVHAFEESATRLQAWYDGGRRGERPPGRLLPIKAPELGKFARLWADIPLRLLHDPDGRPKPLRKRDEF